MAEERVRQLIAWQMKQIEARGRRSSQDRYREQEYFRMFREGAGEPLDYGDDGQGVGGDGHAFAGPNHDGGRDPFSRRYSAHGVADDVGDYAELRASTPSVGRSDNQLGRRSCLYHSVPSGLHITSCNDPDLGRKGEPGYTASTMTNGVGHVLNRSFSGEAPAASSGDPDAKRRVQRSRSFSEHLNDGDLDLFRDPRKAALRRRAMYGSTPTLSSHVMDHMTVRDVYDDTPTPPPSDNLCFSPALIPFPLSSWSSMSSMTNNWHSSKIEEEVEGECKKTVILAKQKAFNENCCMRCFSRFIFIINQKVQCYQCKYYVCKSCSEYDSNRREYICNVCKKQSELQNQSLNWFYDSVKNRFKRFGSAKVVRSLYKRRIDSDSDTEIRQDQSGYSSEPVGRRARQNLQGLFEADLDQSEKEITNDDQSGGQKKCPRRCFSTPYSCPVGTGRETFDQVKDAELNTYRNSLKCVIQDIENTLDAHSLKPVEVYKQENDLLLVQKLQLTSLLSNLSQSLHIAVDNQDPSECSASPIAKHQLVKDILVSEVEDFVGKPVTLASVAKDGVQSYEEQLAKIILNKVVDDYHQKVLQQAKDEEADVCRSFTKLSNLASLEQIKDKYISESETDITSSQLDEPMSEGENHPSDGLRLTHDQASKEALQVTTSIDESLPQEKGKKQTRTVIDTSDKGITSPRDSDSGIVSSPTNEHPMQLRQSSGENDEENEKDPLTDWAHDYSTNRKVATKAPTLSRSVTPRKLRDGKNAAWSSFDDSTEWDVVAKMPRTDQNSNMALGTIPVVPDEELDDIVTNNLINEKWSVVESRTSCVLSDDENSSGQRDSERTAGDVTELSQLKQQLDKSRSIPISHQENDKQNQSPSDSDSDAVLGRAEELADASVPDHKSRRSSSVFDDVVVDDGYHNKAHVPLPSFSSSQRLSFESGDLDDISSFHTSDDEDTASTFSTQISFGRTWNFASTDHLFRNSGKISAYDNFGEKKVGRDIEGPIIMLVPDGPDKSSTIKVGDRDLDELSDLSENTTLSLEEGSDGGEVRNDDNDDDDDGDLSRVREAMHKVFSQEPNSDDMSASRRHVKPPVQNSSPSVIKDAKVSKSKPKITAEKLLALEVVSTEKEESDPKFLIRPTDVTVLEGDVARFSCQVSGTKPIDVFWHKEGEDVIELNDLESCECRYDGSAYYLDIYNTTLADQSQILCIGVNDLGRCVQGVRLFVQENPGDKKAPEFLKPLRDVEVKPGARVKFRVKLSGYPQPKVNWYKDGKKLKTSEQHRLEKQGNRDYLLCINCATLDDDAEYAVIAKNIVGQARTSAQLVVDEGGPEVEFSSLTSSQISLPSSPPPPPPTTQTKLVTTDQDHSDDALGLYPDTEELLKLADKVHQTRGDVTSTATKMLRSAGQMSTLHQQLDEMDRKLNEMETKVKDTSDNSIESNAYKEIFRNQILQEHEEMQTSASAVRNITSTAIDLLQSTDEIIQVTKESQGLKRKSELISSAPQKKEEPELVELKLTFLEFDKLYSAGKITRQQMSSGMVPRSVYNACMEYLRAEAKPEEGRQKSHDLVLDDLPSSIDCGLKRIDSKRYKRDYVINKDKTSNQERKSESRSSSGSLSSDVVKSTPAGTREDPHEKISEAQEQIYLAAGRVNHLQQKIEHLEDKVTAADDKSVTDLEEQVARTVAQVKTSERKVSLVEQHVKALESKTKEVSREPLKERRSTSSLKKDQQSFNESESQTKSPPADETKTNSKAVSRKVTEEVTLKPLVTPVTKVTSTMGKDPSVTVLDRSDSASSPSVVKSPEPEMTLHKPKTETINLHGESSEDVLPESRTEIEPSLSLPSVKSLKSKFDLQPVDKEDGSNFKRVYSLTGRDLPKTVREKLRQNRASKITNPNIRSAEAVRPHCLSSVFERPDGDMNEPRSSTPIMNRMPSPAHGSVSESSKESGPVRSSVSLNLSHVSSISSPQENKTAPMDFKPSEHMTTSNVTTGSIPTTPQSPAPSTSTKNTSQGRRKSSTILARAAFWDSRINKEVVSDVEAEVEKFPELPAENFKSLDNSHL